MQDGLIALPYRVGICPLHAWCPIQQFAMFARVLQAVAAVQKQVAHLIGFRGGAGDQQVPEKGMAASV